MNDTPLSVNVLGSLVQNIGLGINPQAAASTGASSTTANYTPGSICNDTCLDQLTAAINDAYTRGLVDAPTYANLISIGAGEIPALGNAPPATYTWAPYTGVITSWGYIKLFALQAYDEFNYNETLPEYRDFLGSMNAAYSFVEYSNQTILAVQNSKTFLQGTYSNMNDLISADVTGVTLATVSFGQDFITLGKAIDLASIATFGLPSNLLMTLQRYNALTKSVTLALLSTGMTTSEISDILGKVNPITTTQERFIYAAFSIIVGQDLSDVCIPLNCKTSDLTSLTDLLNPKMLFPNSYASLTVPVYNASPGPTNSKTYYPIYEGPGVSSRLGTMDFGAYLINILPDNVAISAGAFSVTMQQIRNISSTPVEKYAQVVGHIETGKDLTQINGSTVPVDSALANAASALIAKGSGPYGTYTMSDFFGCMTGLPYDWANIQSQITDLQSSTLVSIYSSLYVAVTTPVPVMLTIQNLIDNANAEIKAIKAAQPMKAGAINALWDTTGTQLTIEQQARTTGLSPLPAPRNDNITRFPTTHYSFVDSIPRMALNTSPNMTAQTLEAISDICTPGGQSIVGMMREARNQARLSLAGIPLDNTIPDKLPSSEDKVLIANGSLPDTTPATLEQTRCSDGSLIKPEPSGVYNSIDDNYYVTNPAFGGVSVSAGVPTSGVSTTIIVDAVSPGPTPGDGYISGDVVMIQGGDGTFSTAVVVAAAGSVTGFSSFTPGSYIVSPAVLINVPTLVISGAGDNTLTANINMGIGTIFAPSPGGTPVDTGQAVEPGSLAGSPYTRLIPPNLNVMYTSDILLPATLTPAEAINTVIECNCDCWVSP